VDKISEMDIAQLQVYTMLGDRTVVHSLNFHPLVTDDLKSIKVPQEEPHLYEYLKKLRSEVAKLNRKDSALVKKQVNAAIETSSLVLVVLVKVSLLKDIEQLMSWLRLIVIESLLVEYCLLTLMLSERNLRRNMDLHST
jgi:hypothetical protein